MKKVAILVLLTATIVACQLTENKTVSTTDSTSIEVDSMEFEPIIQDTFTTEVVN